MAIINICVDLRDNIKQKTACKEGKSRSIRVIFGIFVSFSWKDFMGK